MTGTGGGGRFLHWIPAVTLADAGPGRPAFALDSCFRVRRHRHSCESRNPVAGAGMAGGGQTNSPYRSNQLGLHCSISCIFQERFHAFSLFSLWIALSMQS